jgi:hypothetical protein
MNNCITIETELLNKGKWIKVNIPKSRQSDSCATILTIDGEILKKVTLSEGCNAIDISGIAGNSVNIKVETACETVLKNIKLDQ